MLLAVVMQMWQHLITTESALRFGIMHTVGQLLGSLF